MASAVTKRAFGDFLEDAAELLKVASSVAGACDAFVEVLVLPKKVDGQIQYTKVEAGPGHLECRGAVVPFQDRIVRVAESQFGRYGILVLVVRARVRVVVTAAAT